MSFKTLATTLLFGCLSLAAYAQSVTVKGVVKDEGGETVIGAAVLEKGVPQNGVTTGADGIFSIDVRSKNATLVVSCIGYVEKEIRLDGKNHQIIVLKEDAQLLEEAVAIGYGTQRRSDVTGSIASVGGDVLREVPATNISYALQNRVAGVEMTQTSSQPGAAMQIRIRGQRSLTASNDPLIVLDGIPFMGSISDINPNDIKSMDILKDASSTAIYGSRGANGVILITTNRGLEGSPAKVSYNGYAGAKTVFARYPMMQGEKFVQMRGLAGKFANGDDEADNVNTDWQDLFYRTGMVNSHDVSVAGGTRGGNYSFGAGYYRDEAVVPTQYYDRYSIHSSFDQGVGKYFRFGLATNSSYSMNHGGQIGLYNVLSASPIADPFNSDGTLKRTIKTANDEAWVMTRGVVDGLKDEWINETAALATYNNFYGEVQAPWVKGLKYRINIGLNYRSSKNGQYTGVGVNNTNPNTESSASVMHQETLNWTVEHLLSYDRIFADRHKVSAVAMYSAEQTKFTQSHMSAQDIPSPDFQYYNLGHALGTKTINPAYQGYWMAGLVSWMGRVSYSYDNKYMLMATVRSDGSSRLAKGHQWHTYPAVSLGWNMKRESFMEDIHWLDALKLRAGYGQTSNQAVNPYSTLGSLATRPYNFGDAFATGYYVSTLPNNLLGWEYSSTWNFGVDFALFNNRLSGTLEYYIQKTSDLLLNVSLPGTAGVGSYTGNVGNTENKGIELTINGTIIDNLDGWTWDAGLNLYANRNRIVSLASGADRDEGNGWFVGYPIDVIYDYQYEGIWQQDDKYLDILEPGGNVGMIKVKYTGDYNENGAPTRSVNASDRQIQSMEPKFQGGFNTRVAYKGFELSAVGAFKCGGILISSLHSSSGYLNMLTGRRGNVDVDYWTPENTGARYPLPGGIQSGDNPKYGSTLGYFDASYIKLRTITLAYTFNDMNWLRKLGASNLRVYATVQNPFVIYAPFTAECGLDPETNSYNDQNVAVSMKSGSHSLPIIGTNSPTTRNYLFGINLTF